jgi:Bacterial Ig-like domain/Beta-propeller repeat
MSFIAFNRSRLGTFFSFIAVLFFSACGGGGSGDGGGEGNPSDTTAPTVSSVTPVDGAVGVAATSFVQAIFSESIDSATLTSATFTLLSGGSSVSGTLTSNDDKFTFESDSTLSANTRYTGTLTTGVTDLAGTPLPTTFSWTFKTEATPWPGTKQLGTAGDDKALASAVDRSRNIYVTGLTFGDLDGAGNGISSGNSDIFLVKYNAEGTLEWIVQSGTINADEGTAVAVDSGGNVYVAGSTSEDLDGTDPGVYFGNKDLFLAKYDSSGTLLWIAQQGTVNIDMALSVTVDSGDNVYVAGFTGGDLDGADPGFYSGNSDLFLIKYDSSGILLWIEQLGTVGDDEGRAVKVDASDNVYVTGSTNGDLDGADPGVHSGNTDLFLVKYDSSGTLVWTAQLGTVAADEARDIAFDSTGNAYVTGFTSEDLDGSESGVYSGNADLFLVKYSSAGTLQWIEQLGVVQDDDATGVVVDAAGSIYVTGYTEGDLGGSGFVGNRDLFLVKYDSSRHVQWKRQLGTVADDEALSISALSLLKGGNLFLAGYTKGDLDGNSLVGNADLFLSKYDPFGNLQ